MSTNFTPLDLQSHQLPTSILTYLRASKAPKTIEVFIEDPQVTDNGTRYASRKEVLHFLTSVTTEYAYTTTFQRAAQAEPDQYAVWNRLEGNFPGSTADLKYTFNLHNGLIRSLEITAA
ncbi:hypothetical protein [Arthrobacter sp. SAFR-044]|uniref:hypothetical protein n=1 Tax=Arthrobacter sp. SAFR-044 TaxID=3387278 RepID=UPI003F7B5040